MSIRHHRRNANHKWLLIHLRRDHNPQPGLVAGQSIIRIALLPVTVVIGNINGICQRNAILDLNPYSLAKIMVITHIGRRSSVACVAGVCHLGSLHYGGNQGRKQVPILAHDKIPITFSDAQMGQTQSKQWARRLVGWIRGIGLVV